MTRCHAQLEVLQDGKGKEAIEPGASRTGRGSPAGQDYEVRYTAKKTKKSAGAVKKAVKKVGSSRKRVERRLGR
jgi:hypothetical protein